MVIYPLCFLIELFISESIFLLGQRRKPRFPARLLLAVAVSAGLAIGLNYLFSLLPDTIPIRIVFFLCFYGISVQAIATCFDIPLTQVLFIATAGYSVEHIADSAVKILLAVTPLGNHTGAAASVLILTVPYVLCAALSIGYLLLLHCLMRRYSRGIKEFSEFPE